MNLFRNRIGARVERRGVSLLLVAFTVAGLAMVSLALFTTVSSTGKAQKSSREELNARLVTEAGLAEAMLQLSRGESPILGSEQAPASFGSGSYWVNDTIYANGLHRLVATGVENGVGSRLEVVVREVSNNLFYWAAFGDDGLSMSSNARVDSYNSSLGSYDLQDINGSGSSKYANSNGHIGSNGNVHANQNAKVYGNAVPGPGSSVTAIGNSVITGSTTPSTTVVDLPAINVPSIASIGNFSVGSNSSHSIPSGSHHIDQFTIGSNSEVSVTGPATLVFESFNMGSGSELIVDATNGPVTIYVIDDFVMNSNTLIASTTFTPADVSINLLSDNIIDPGLQVDLDEVDFDSNAELFGTIYAPNAAIYINSNFELYGSLVAKSVRLDSNSKVHFDEALLTANATNEIQLETVAWRQLPYHP